jgi:hypothetical protein
MIFHWLFSSSGICCSLALKTADIAGHVVAATAAHSTCTAPILFVKTDKTIYEKTPVGGSAMVVRAAQITPDWLTLCCAVLLAPGDIYCWLLWVPRWTLPPACLRRL